jgi:hypothetical protein
MWPFLEIQLESVTNLAESIKKSKIQLDNRQFLAESLFFQEIQLILDSVMLGKWVFLNFIKASSKRYNEGTNPILASLKR